MNDGRFDSASSVNENATIRAVPLNSDDKKRLVLLRKRLIRTLVVSFLCVASFTYALVGVTLLNGAIADRTDSDQKAKKIVDDLLDDLETPLDFEGDADQGAALSGGVHGSEETEGVEDVAAEDQGYLL